MASMTVVRRINAPVETVFHAIADPRQFAHAVGGVTKLEFLSDSTTGVHTRFRQSRANGGKEMTMDFEVTEHVPNDRVRIVNEIHGTVWDSIFTVAPSNGGTMLTMRMDTFSRPLLPRLLMPIMLALFIKKAVAKDIDAVKAFCERRR